ncbi:hypothetical protein [Gemmobacter sp. 24YEA27]|uniref:hypothetical protein n=1 Tax=Gemmobacter sp. 24YEA27 TaxID=3040672 RepID=UPI0024B379BB|nr:hypothetical protein [Gemmobacter sp. 24YEA27]
MRPIFILWTRSFWLGIFPSLLIVLDLAVNIVAAVASDPALVPPVATLIGWLFGGDPVVIEGWMLRIAPLLALVIAQQRAGSARPYTANPRARQ